MANTARQPNKSGVNSGSFKPGQDSRRGKGPKPGTGGRPTNEYKAFLCEIVSEPHCEKRLQRMLKSRDYREFMEAYKYCSDKGYGKAPQPIEGGDEAKPLTIVLKHE